jgi:hypothetical protein
MRVAADSARSNVVDLYDSAKAPVTTVPATTAPATAAPATTAPATPATTAHATTAPTATSPATTNSASSFGTVSSSGPSMPPGAIVGSVIGVVFCKLTQQQLLLRNLETNIVAFDLKDAV